MSLGSVLLQLLRWNRFGRPMAQCHQGSTCLHAYCKLTFSWRFSSCTKQQVSAPKVALTQIPRACFMFTDGVMQFC